MTAPNKPQMTWEDVVGSAEYHALPREEQVQWKQDYFNEVLAPMYKPEELESVKNDFMNDLEDPNDQIIALSNRFIKQKNPKQEEGGVFAESGLPGMMASFPGAVQSGQLEQTMGKDLNAVERFAPDAAQLGTGLALGPMNLVPGVKPVAGGAGRAVGTAVSELTKIMRGKKEFSYEDFSKEVGKGFNEGLAGEVGGKILGFVMKNPFIRGTVGAGIGGYFGYKAGDKVGGSGDLDTAGKVAGTVAGGATGALAGINPKKAVELGIRTLGNVSEFATKRLLNRGADVVLSEEKLDPGFFGKIGQQAIEAFDSIKEDAYKAFQKTADSIKWSPSLKIDTTPIQNDLRKELTRMGVLKKSGDIAQETLMNSTPQMKKLLEIYQAVRGNDIGKFPKKFMSFQEASQLMNYLDNAIPESSFGQMNVSSPFVGALKTIKSEISNSMKTANPVLRHAYEDYSAFAELRNELTPMLKSDVTAEGAMKNLLSGSDTKLQAMEKFLNQFQGDPTKGLPAGREIMENLRDGAAAKEFFYKTVQGLQGIRKEGAAKTLKKIGDADRMTKPVREFIGKTVEKTLPTGLSDLLNSYTGRNK